MRAARKTNELYTYLMGCIENGRFRIGEQIPTERDLAARFKLSRPTVAAAIHRLVKENMIRRGHKNGSVVVNLPPRKSLTFGAIILGLARHGREDTIFSSVGNEISYCASLDHSVVLLQDPSWGDEADDPGLTDRYRSMVDQFIARKVAGVFLMPQWILPNQHISVTTSLIEKLSQASIPVVLIDGDIIRYPARSRLDLIGIDNFHSGYILAEHIITQGCRKIDFFALATRHPTQEARIAGYQKAMEVHGLRPDVAAVHYGDLLGGDFVVQTLRRRRPDAILVANDFRAVSVMRMAREAGFKIPSELRVGSFDDIPLSAHLPVPLTTIRQPSAGIGLAAYQCMLQRINTPGIPPMHVQLSADLVVRESCGCRIRLGSPAKVGTVSR